MALIEEITRLTTPAPIFQDPEDSLEDETIARLAEKGDNEEFTPLISSKLRQRAAVVEADTDRRYTGKKTSRREIASGDFEESDNDEDAGSDASMSVSESEEEEENDGTPQDSDVTSSEEEKDEEKYEEDREEEADLQKFKSKLSLANQGASQNIQKEFSFTDDGDYGKYGDDDDNDDDSDEDDNSDDDGSEDDDDDDDDDDENSDDEEHLDEDEDGVSSFSKNRIDEEVQKGNAAKQQLGLWDNLLESRIKFQKTISAINQLPQPDTWQAFVRPGGDNFTKNASTVQSMLKDLLDKLLQLQTILLLQNSETRSVVTGESPKDVPGNDDDDDEEITSESETEKDAVKTKEKVDYKAGMKRKWSVEEYPEFLAKRHLDFEQYRNNTIQKWFDKTRLSGGKLSSKSFGGFEQSALKQIKQILCDKERLVRRTQLKRSSYTVLGKQESDDSATANEGTSNSIADSDNKHYDSEIFDDSDFYHQQLRELIERKTSDMDDPVALSRQWLEIQKLRNKVKKHVDTKASKGRKLRYDVHAKLVNFMAPKDDFVWSDEARDDLFKSLFGKRFQSKADDAAGS